LFLARKSSMKTTVEFSNTQDRQNMTTVTLDYQEYDRLISAVQWCQDNIGVENYEIESAWPADRLYFRFRDPLQATLFKLRWSL
jgi:hypothetical protein